MMRKYKRLRQGLIITEPVPHARKSRPAAFGPAGESLIRFGPKASAVGAAACVGLVPGHWHCVAGPGGAVAGR